MPLPKCSCEATYIFYAQFVSVELSYPRPSDEFSEGGRRERVDRWPAKWIGWNWREDASESPIEQQPERALFLALAVETFVAADDDLPVANGRCSVERF